MNSMARMWVQLLAIIPLDLGQGRLRHTTAAKQIAFRAVPKAGSGARVLDLGCGDGYWSERLRAFGYTVTATDVPRQYPNEDADVLYPAAIMVDANGPLPFPNASFDLVWCSEVIEHLRNYRGAVREALRVLRPGGSYIFTTPNSYFWLHYTLRCLGWSHRDWQNEGHVNFFRLRDVRALFPNATVLGYFPYALVKYTIQSSLAVRALSPSFVIVGRKENGSQLD